MFRRLQKKIDLQIERVFDTVTEGLENLRNNQGNIIYSFNPINDQENSDLQRDTQNSEVTFLQESFNEQSPSDRGSSSDSSLQVF